MQKLLQNKIGVKFFVIAGLTILLLIPLAMIEGLIRERSKMQEGVEQEITKRSSAAQTIIGPFVHVQYRENVLIDGKQTEKNRDLFIMPDSLFANSELSTFEKYRGIYKALLYTSKNNLSGRFDFAPVAKLDRSKIDKLNLVMAIEDVRGIGIGSRIALAGVDYPLTPGTQISRKPDGIHIKLNYDQLDFEQSLAYTVDFELLGMKSLNFAPVGKETRIDVSADWPHPSFVGDYLPTQSDINDQGFKAQWTTNSFSTNMAQAFSSCIIYNSCEARSSRIMGVSLIDPVNHYLKSHRAVSYALLIILMVFACFFLLELLRAKPIHPIQYGFVGLALAVFYLLLISLSEHFGFALAYLLSGVASVSLLSIYVAGVFHDSKQGLGCFASLSVLYGILYGLLSAEDYALLMGSLLCFIVLSMLMLLTRKVDWYSNKSEQPEIAI